MTAKRAEPGDASLVWGSGVDDGAWWVQVTDGTERYSGVLRVFQGDSLDPVYECDVELPYGAQFGPDAYNLYEWQTSALKVIDSLSS